MFGLISIQLFSMLIVYLVLDRVLGSGKVKASQELFTQALDAAVTGLYGIIGGAFNWDLVEFDEDNGVAIIVSQKRYQRFF